MWNFSSIAVPPEVNSRSSVALCMVVLSVSQCPASDFSFSNASAPPPGAAFDLTAMIPMLNTNTPRILAKPFIDRSPFRKYFNKKTLLENSISAGRGSRGRTVALRGVTHNHPHDTAGQDDFEVVAVLHVGHEIRKHESHGQAEQNAEWHGIHLARKNASRYSGNQPLDRRTKNDSHQLRPHSRSEPCRPAVDRTKYGPDQKSQQHFIHHIPPSRFVSLLILTTNKQIPLRLSVHEKQNQGAHRQVRCNQQDKEAVAPVKTPSLLKDTFPVGINRKPIQVARNIQGHLWNVGIAVCRSRRRGLCADSQQRFIETASSRTGGYFRTASEQEAQERTEGINITSCVQVFHVAARLFRRHVSGRAHDRAVSGHDRKLRGIAGSGRLLWIAKDRGFRIGFARAVRNLSAQNFGEAPVHHQDFTEGADHNVCGLQIAVQHAARVRERHGVANAEKNAQTVRDGCDRLDILVEPPALDEFHGVENAAVRERSHVVDRHDAGMLERREHAGLANQTVGELAVCFRNIEYFQRDATVKVLIFRNIHLSHTAARDALQQTVAGAGKIGKLRAAAQSFQRAVGKKFHLVSQPKAARASRRNSSSLPQSSRRRPRAIFRNSRRAQASALVTSLTEIP